MSAFNRLAVPQYTVSIGDERLTLRSEPGDLFHFDFQSGGPFPEDRASTLLTATGGLVNGVAQWLRFELDDEHRYEILPTKGAYSVFAVVFYRLRLPVNTSVGGKFLVCGTHDRQSLRIWLEAPHGSDASN